MRDVLTVLATVRGAYDGAPDSKAVGPTGWKAWLDAIDEEGMFAAGQEDTHTVADILVKYGIATEDDLSGRAEARADLDRLRTEPNGWAVPPTVLASMSRWSFDTAEAAISEVDATRATVAKVEATLPSVKAASSIVRPDVEHATDLATLTKAHATASSQLEAATAVAEANTAAGAATEPLQQLGLMGTDLPGMEAAAVAAVAAGDMNGARTEAASIAQLVTDSTSLGLTRAAVGIAVVIAVVMLLVLAAYLIRRRRRSRPVAAQAPVAFEPPMDLGLLDEAETATIVYATESRDATVDPRPAGSPLTEPPS